MATVPSCNVLFVPYRTSSSPPEGSREVSGISQQKHAALEYHRRLKLERLATFPGTIKSQKSSKIAMHTQEPQSSLQPPLCPRSHNSTDHEDRSKRPSLHIWDLGVGQLDPFNVSVPRDTSPYSLEMLDHASSYQWPVFSISKTVVSVSNIKRAILACAMASPASFYTIIFAGATHSAFVHADMEALRALKAEIQALDGEPSDELLLSMVALSAHGSGELLNPPKRATSSALATAQSFQYYGNMKFEMAHLKALALLLEQKGGLKKVKMPGLASAIELAFTFIAFQQLTRPCIPLLVPTSLVMSTWPIPTLLTRCHNDLCTGFDSLPRILTSLPLFTVIQNIRTITIGYSMYISHHPQAPSLARIVWARNSVQHDLLSVPDAAAEAMDDNQAALYELTRLSGLAYMVLVLFPLPRFAGIHAKIGRQLMLSLDECTELGLWDAYPSLLLWSTILGGILSNRDEDDDPSSSPSSETDEEATMLISRFVKMTTRAGVKHQPSAWGLVKDMCRRFLWFEGDECEGVAKVFWALACETVLLDCTPGSVYIFEDSGRRQAVYDGRYS